MTGTAHVVHADAYPVRLYGRTAHDRVIPPPALIEPYMVVNARRFERAAMRMTYLTLRDYVDAADARQIVLALLQGGRRSEWTFDTWRRHPSFR